MQNIVEVVWTSKFCRLRLFAVWSMFTPCVTVAVDVWSLFWFATPTPKDPFPEPASISELGLLICVVVTVAVIAAADDD